MKVRTVLQLDRRPGEPITEIRTVAGLTIDAGIPLPPPRAHDTPIILALLALEIGDSVVYESESHSWRIAKKIIASRRKFTERLIAPGKHRIWRRE